MGKFLVTLFLGWAGIHKFMEKKTGMGVLYLCTMGLFGIGWIVDIVIAALAIRKTESVQGINDPYYNYSFAETQAYIEQQNAVRPYSEKYYKGMEEIESMWSVLYNLKITSGEKVDLFEQKCKQNIIDFYNMIAVHQKYDSNFSISHVPAYVRLAMLYEKQGRYEEGINICVEAIKAGATTDGNKGKMYGRLARLIKKSGLSVDEETLQLSMKTE